MNPSLFILILVSVAMSACAQLLLKLGVAPARASDPAADAATSLAAYLVSPLVIGGFALYGFGAILWLFVLARLPLTAAYPFVGLGFIITMLLGVMALGEAVTPMRLLGTVMIATGCVLVARSVA